jgi:hypothetical protein
MNREDIIRLAREAGIADSWDLNWQDKIIEHFAKLVAQHEREVCAKICDAINNEYDGEEVPASWIATAIRSRGNT